MVARQSACLRRVAQGRRSGIVGFGRFLGNSRVTIDRLVEGWGEGTALAAAGRHVLAIQDLSEINFSTGPERHRGLGKIGRGAGHGLLLHAMLGVDADDGALLGLVSGRLWTRGETVSVPHAKRRLEDKESGRWLETAQAAKGVLSRAAQVTVVADRESDIYAEWARLPGQNFHLLTRATADRRTRDGKLSTTPLTPAGEAVIEVAARPGRSARTARLRCGFARVSIQRPANTIEADLPASVELTLIEVAEADPPKGEAPILWRLLTTHPVTTPEEAWRIVGWYRRRWIIEQLFRTLKQQGLQIEDSQLESAERLLKLTAIAASAACVILQMVQARDGSTAEPADLVFTPPEIEALKDLIPTLEGATQAQKNPHTEGSMAWAAWAIAKLGGWDGYASSRPPGPITFRHGLEAFRHIAKGWALRNV